MRLFGGSKMDSIANMMQKADMSDDMPIQASMVSKSIESAQRQVETMHFSARKNVLEYDDVMNLQRKAIYEERNAILDGKDVSESIPAIIDDSVAAIVSESCPDRSTSDEWDVKAIDLWAANMTGRSDFAVEKLDHDDESSAVADALERFLEDVYREKEGTLGENLMKPLSSQVMLRIIDTRWMAHLQEMDYLKTGIGLRAFGQRDPLTEYREGGLHRLREPDRHDVRRLPAHDFAPRGGQERPCARRHQLRRPACPQDELLLARAGA